MLVSFSRLPCHAHKRITLKASYKIYSLDFVKTFKFFLCVCAIVKLLIIRHAPGNVIIPIQELCLDLILQQIQ